jgi:shikimate kinase
MGSAGRDRALLLCGMMGVGKTQVGRLLASRLGWEFVDTDERIESGQKRSVARIFAEEGEQAFRALEREVLEQLPGQAAVIALGGGAVVAPENRALLRERGTLVWLDAEPEVLAARIGEREERPLLAGLDAEARVVRLRELRAEREPSYACADLRIATDDTTPQRVCDGLLAALGWEDAA